MQMKTQTELQSLEWTIPVIKKAFNKNRNRSISALFRYFRQHSRLSLIGCYPILATIVHAAIDIGIKLNRSKVGYALNNSEELRQFSKQEKKLLLDQLIKSSYVQIKHKQNSSIFNRNKKEDMLPIINYFPHHYV